MEQEEPKPRWRPKCWREPRQRGSNLICLWRAAENKQRPVKLPLGRPCFTVCIEVWQLWRIKINHLLYGLQKWPDTTVYFFCGMKHGFWTSGCSVYWYCVYWCLKSAQYLIFTKQSIQTDGLLCLHQIHVTFLCGKRLNFFRILQAGFVQPFPYGCLPHDTSHITGALKGHQSLWTGTLWKTTEH